ncbi:MAG: ATP-binding protein, partial [Thermomicrobiales bacterium]|nr:ATP-binding protein [Thermomicrobiales bacterium]
KNYPLVCQSLQALAGMAYPGGARFDWNTPLPFREIFRERLFDALGRFDPPSEAGQRQPWATRRSRFNSQLPLEYAYAAWGLLPNPDAGERDHYRPYRRATVELITAFQARRLEAIEHVASDFVGNRDTTKTPFRLPDLASFNSKAGGLAEALQEFLTLERHVVLAAWKSARLPPPERRVLAGDTLVARFLDEDQDPEVLAALRENDRREPLRAAAREAFFAENPDKKQAKLPPDVKAATEPLPIPGPYRFRLETAGTGVSLDDVLALSTLKEGDRVVVEPRWTVDSRLPAAEQHPLQPTPKQLLRGMRLTLRSIEKEKRPDGSVPRAWLHAEEVSVATSSDNPPGYLFRGFREPLVDGGLYTFDADPNDIYGFWQAKVVQGLLEGGQNELFRRVQPGAPAGVNWPAAAAAGQQRFFDGLRAMHAAGLTVSFEASKAAFIGEHGDAPLMLVQGPPGTGKSFTTAFAILARAQGALAAGLPYRVLLGAKTHAATDVLLANVLAAIASLERMAAAAPALFAQYFDRRLLTLPCYRINPRDGLPDGAEELPVGQGSGRPLRLLQTLPVAVVGATPGGVYRAVKAEGRTLFDHPTFELLVLDEASQISLPEAIMAALPLRADGQVMVVGDHRQMPPIVQHDWDNETRRTFQDYEVYQSLFDTVRACQPVQIQFQQTFRLHRDMAEFLRRSVYTLDGLHYFSEREHLLSVLPQSDPFVAAVLDPTYPIVVITHGERSSQLRNDFERDLTAPLLAALFAEGFSVSHGFGMVVPHRAQRASLQETLRAVVQNAPDADIAAAVDTVERFQGGERQAIIISATESDPAYLLASGKFLYDPRRLTVAISRAKEKLVVVASRAVFETFSPDEQTFYNTQLWKDLLHRICTTSLWRGERLGHAVDVWGNPPLDVPAAVCHPPLNVNMATSGMSSVPPAAW